MDEGLASFVSAFDVQPARKGARQKTRFPRLPKETLYKWLVRLVETKPWPEGCVDWPGTRDGGGYGLLSVDGRRMGVHRLALHLAGETRVELHVLHRCLSNKRCCNPAHLYAGTQKDNARDRMADGTSAMGDKNGSRLHPENRPRGATHGLKLHPEAAARGDRNGARTHPERVARGATHGSRLRPERCPRGDTHGNARLTSGGVQECRARYAAGDCSAASLAKEYGVTKSAMYLALTEKTWKHVVGLPPAAHKQAAVLFDPDSESGL